MRRVSPIGRVVGATKLLPDQRRGHAAHGPRCPRPLRLSKDRERNGRRQMAARQAPSGARPNVPRLAAQRHRARPGAFARLPAAKAFAVRSHKYPSLHDFPTFARRRAVALLPRCPAKDPQSKKSACFSPLSSASIEPVRRGEIRHRGCRPPRHLGASAS
jgi:hypothetical protein